MSTSTLRGGLEAPHSPDTALTSVDADAARGVRGEIEALLEARKDDPEALEAMLKAIEGALDRLNSSRDFAKVVEEDAALRRDFATKLGLTPASALKGQRIPVGPEIILEMLTLLSEDGGGGRRGGCGDLWVGHDPEIRYIIVNKTSGESYTVFCVHTRQGVEPRTYRKLRGLQ